MDTFHSRLEVKTVKTLFVNKVVREKLQSKVLWLLTKTVRQEISNNVRLGTSTYSLLQIHLEINK